MLPWVAIVAACTGTSGTKPVEPNDGTTEGEEPSGAPDATVPGSGRIDASAPGKSDSGRPNVDASADAAGEADATEPVDDAGDVDAAMDAALDADADAGPPIEACVAQNDLESRVCGKCGTQSRLCASVEGKLVWLPWGECIKETGSCYPGTFTNVPCGRCGFRQRLCSDTCQIDEGVCQDRPGAECYAGDGDWQEALSCPSGLGRTRTCQQITCRWTSYSAECLPYSNPNFVVASTVAGSGTDNLRTGVFSLTNTKKAPRLSTWGTCPLGATATFSTSTPASFVEVRNPSATASLKLTIWSSATPEMPTAQMIIAAYAGVTKAPENDVERRACSKGISSSCSGFGSTPCFAALDGGNAVTLPPSGSALVYSARYYDEGDADDRYQLNVRTEAVTPVP